MIASLPMYDRPENRTAHDALWAGVRAQLGFGPERLNRDIGYFDSWGRPDLLLGQICNLPYRAQFRGRVTRIGCADYGLPDTPPGYYHSVFVVRAEDAARGLAPAVLGRFAYNDGLSQSGWGAPLAHIKQRGLRFHTTLQTGAHIESLRAVAEGRADLAAVDAVTWRDLQKFSPFTQQLQVIDRTRASPGMTFITAPAHDPAPIADALARAIETLAQPHREALGLRGIAVLPDAAYDIPLPSVP